MGWRRFCWVSKLFIYETFFFLEERGGEGTGRDLMGFVKERIPVDETFSCSIFVLGNVTFEEEEKLSAFSTMSP